MGKETVDDGRATADRLRIRTKAAIADAVVVDRVGGCLSRKIVTVISDVIDAGRVDPVAPALGFVHKCSHFRGQDEF